MIWYAISPAKLRAAIKKVDADWFDDAAAGVACSRTRRRVPTSSPCGAGSRVFIRESSLIATALVRLGMRSRTESRAGSPTNPTHQF